MTDKELKRMRKSDLIEIIYQMNLEASDTQSRKGDGKNNANTAIPTLKEIEAKRNRYLHRHLFRLT